MDPPRARPRFPDDLLSAAAFLTRIPLPAAGGQEVMRCAAYFPVVGSAVGLAAGAVLAAAWWLGLPPLACALCALAASAAITGALHEDGLADMADGLGSPDPDRRIAVMRDSRIGTWGVLVLVIATGLKAAALAALLERAGPGAALAALAGVHAAGRAVMVATAAVLEPAREDGLADGLAVHAGRPGWPSVRLALAVAGGVLLLALPVTAALSAAAGAVIGAAAAAGLASRMIGGYTGDTLGAAEQAAETCALLALALALAAPVPA